MRTRSLLLVLVISAAGFLSACGGGQVTVRVMSGPEGAEAAPAEDVEITFLPFDRDSIFEAMASREDTPEPEISEDLRQQYDQVIEAQQAWRDAEQLWSEARDELRRIRNRMQGLDERSREYLQLFEQFNQTEQQVNQLNARRQQLFQRFDSLQKATVARADSVRAVIASWEEEAFRGYTEITDSILQAKGIEELPVDTTGADGYASARLPSGGDWWVYARHTPGPFEELYWNVRIVPSETDTLVLDRENAESRIRL